MSFWKLKPCVPEKTDMLLSMVLVQWARDGNAKAQVLLLWLPHLPTHGKLSLAKIWIALLAWWVHRLVCCGSGEEWHSCWALAEKAHMFLIVFKERCSDSMSCSREEAILSWLSLRKKIWWQNFWKLEQFLNYPKIFPFQKFPARQYCIIGHLQSKIRRQLVYNVWETIIKSKITKNVRQSCHVLEPVCSKFGFSWSDPSAMRVPCLKYSFHIVRHCVMI